ncbi:MAG: hypothetical protein ABI892_20575 [Flavobacterium sp.]
MLLFLLLFFCVTINAQNGENEPPAGFDIGEQLNNVPIDAYVPPDDSWDNASLYWNTNQNEYISNNDDNYTPQYHPPIEKTGPKNEYGGNVENGDGDKQTKSQVLLTKKVMPGETHTQSVKVLRDPSTSTDKKAIGLIVNGVKVGTVTFSAPLRDANGIDIYSKMTVEVFRHCPIAITNITFDNPQTSNYEGSQHSTTSNLKEALTDLSMYQTFDIINFTSPINEEEDIIFTGSFTAANFPDNKKDPCIVAKELTTLAASPVFKKAVQDIRNKPDFYYLEYSISLGKNSAGQIYANTMNSGDGINVPVTHNIEGFFVDLHNHPNGSTHSGRDLSNATVFNKFYPYMGSFVLPHTEQVYAAVITDLAAAQAFVAKYLTDPKTNKPTHYPDFMQEEIVNVLHYMNSYTIESQSRAYAFVVSKYNAGITFFKQNNAGKFYPLTIKETNQANDSFAYTLIPCI